MANEKDHHISRKVIKRNFIQEGFILVWISKESIADKYIDGNDELYQ